MAKDIANVKSVWFWRPLAMLPGGGSTHIGIGAGWKGWKLTIDYTTSELLICPPPDHPMGRIRVPMSNVAAYQLSSAAAKPE